MNKITIVMGNYFQNCEWEKELIEWIVLDSVYTRGGDCDRMELS